MLTILSLSAFSQVITYDFPDTIPGISNSKFWKVKADNKNIRVLQLFTLGTNTWPSPTQNNSGPGSMALFSLSGSATLKVSSKEKITSFNVRPKSLNINATLENDTIIIALEKPAKFCVEINKNFAQPLFIFANPVETPLDPSGPNVTFFEKGKVHNIGNLELKGLSDHTVYIEGGAVLVGSLILNKAVNSTLKGHGILYSGPEISKGPTILKLGNCKNTTIRDCTVITHFDGNYGCAVWNSDTISFTNWKMINTAKDGLDPLGTQHMIVDSCFIFGDDDASAIKTSKYTTQDAAFITIKNSQIWNNSMEIGYETHGGDIHDINYKNIDLVHIRTKSELPDYPLTNFSIHVNDSAHVYNVNYEDIRVESPLSNRLFEFRIMYVAYAANPKDGSSRYRGQLTDVYLKNISVIDGADLPDSYIEGFDKDHIVKNLGIEGFFVDGQEITDVLTGKIATNKFTQNVGLIPLGRGDVVPSAPADFKVKSTFANGQVDMNLSWKDFSDNEWGFTIERNEDGGDYVLAGIVNQNIEHFEDKGLTAGKNYSYKLCASNKAGFSDVVTSDNITGQNDPRFRNQLQLFPNPCHSTLNINSLDLGKVVILDETGRTIHDMMLKAGMNSINTSFLPAGMYVLRMKNYNTKFFKK